MRKAFQIKAVTCLRDKKNKRPSQRTRKRRQNKRNFKSGRQSKCVNCSSNMISTPSLYTNMSSWYWSNYKAAMTWKDKHNVAYWKSYALALAEENRELLQIINKTEVKNETQPSGTLVKQEQVSSDEDESSEDNEIEMSDEMVKYFADSLKHKLQLKKETESMNLNGMQSESTEQDKVLEKQRGLELRTQQMKLLYGEEAAKIVGMETAVQLSFNRYCDTKSPKYWPNIPLNL